MMNRKSSEDVARSLLEEKESLMRQKNSIRGESMGHVYGVSESSVGADSDAVDMAVSISDTEMAIAMESNLSSSVRMIDVALKKIEEGTYGICDVCGGKIAKARLEALPSATLCIGCQMLSES